MVEAIVLESKRCVYPLFHMYDAWKQEQNWYALCGASKAGKP